MKKILEKVKKYRMLIVGTVVGVILIGGGVYATAIGSGDVTYSNAASGLSATTTQQTINELYKKAGKQYFDLATAQVNTTGKIFASKKGVCISRNGTVYCFKINNYNVEKNHIHEVFSNDSCYVDSDSSLVHCYASDFGCNVSSDGDVGCYDPSDYSNCDVDSGGDVDCN